MYWKHVPVSTHLRHSEETNRVLDLRLCCKIRAFAFIYPVFVLTGALAEVVPDADPGVVVPGAPKAPG